MGSLITARTSFFGGHNGAACSETPLSGGDGFYVKDGKLWHEKIHHEVPATNHSVTDVVDYIRELPQNHVVDYTDPAKFLPYYGMMDFVTTCRIACEPKGSAFEWPKEVFTHV